MSAITDIGRGILGHKLYLEALKNLYGMDTKINILKEYSRYMAIKVLDWNDINNYLDQDQLTCLNGFVQRNNKTIK